MEGRFLELGIESKDALDQFLRYIQLEKNFSVHTVREYEIDLKDFLAFLQSEGVTQLNDVEYLHARIYVTKLYDEKKQEHQYLVKFHLFDHFLNF